jgi:hypothetical protein
LAVVQATTPRLKPEAAAGRAYQELPAATSVAPQMVALVET